MKKPAPKQVTVVESKQVTPNMQRVLLQGDALIDFPIECEGSYIKFLFNSAGGTDLSTINEGERPVMRTYTVRRFSPTERTIEVDFVHHLSDDLQGCFATRWAMNVKIGEKVTIAGPGSIKEINTDADWFFMVADMTALPALSAKIRKLPADAEGYAVIQVVEKEDIQLIEAPEKLKVTWIFNNDPLATKVKSLPWLDGTVSVWTACEFDDMRELRDYFQNEKQVNRDHIYISSYWKKGVTEDGHKLIKQQDAKGA